MSGKVLIVDDDANLIAGLKRQLRRRYDLITAQGGTEALAELDGGEPLGVVVCDMRMPGIDGLEVLRRFKAQAPDTVRMMLTGNADQQTAIDAINDGAIFRFFTKPCAPEVLIAGIDAGLEQYRLICAERDLLEKTLAGSIKVLTGVLALNDPDSFGRAQRMRDWVRMIAQGMGLKSRWQLEVAAMLAPLGLISIPPEVLAKRRAGRGLTPDERDMILAAPEAARDLIVNIPRLAPVADIVYLQNKNLDGSGFPEDDPRSGDSLPLDARLLRILVELARASDGPAPPTAAFDALAAKPEHFDPRLVKAIRTALARIITTGPAASAPSAPPPEPEAPPPPGLEGMAVMYDKVAVDQILAGDYLRSDLRLADGHLVLSRGMQFTEAQISRLRNMVKLHAFQEPVEVMRVLGTVGGR